MEDGRTCPVWSCYCDSKSEMPGTLFAPKSRSHEYAVWSLHFKSLRRLCSCTGGFVSLLSGYWHQCEFPSIRGLYVQRRFYWILIVLFNMQWYWPGLDERVPFVSIYTESPGIILDATGHFGSPDSKIISRTCWVTMVKVRRRGPSSWGTWTKCLATSVWISNTDW